MKGFLFLVVAVFSSPLMAHYKCEGICKYYMSGNLQTSVVTGSGSSHSGAIDSMRNSCSNFCSTYYTGCEIINYTCSTPEHEVMFSEALEANVSETEKSNGH